MPGVSHGFVPGHLSKKRYIDHAKTPFIVVNILFGNKSCIIDVRSTIVNTLFRDFSGFQNKLLL